MFGWFSTKCPVSTAEKAWTEKRMCWLAEQFGIKRLLEAQVVVPDDHFFPTPYEPTREYAQRLMQRIGKEMGVRTDHIKFEICDDHQMPGQAGHYEPGDEIFIRVKRSLLEESQCLAATLAHELSHEILLGGGLLADDVIDHEWVTDLLPLFFGMGICAANSTVKEENKRYGNWYLWGIGKQGYLSARVFGYAFALFAFMRAERNPEWAKHLRLDAAESLRMGLRYLRKTNDTAFHPDTVGQPQVRASADEIMNQLKTGTPSVRIAALWEIRDHQVSTPAIVEQVAWFVSGRDADIARAACDALAALGSAAADAVPEIISALQAPDEETRIGAALALGAICAGAEQTVAALGFALEDDCADVVKAAAEGLRPFGLQANIVVPRLLAALSKAFADCNHPRIEALVATLQAIASNPSQQLREYYDQRDPELGRWAMEELRKQPSTS
jgi:hypothetical protein